MVELRPSCVINESLTSHHGHMDAAAVVSLVMELTWKGVHWLVWSEALEQSWLRYHRVVVVVNHGVVLGWHYLSLISRILYLAIHLLSCLGPKHLCLVLLWHCLEDFPIWTKAVLVDATVRAVVALIVGADDVLRSRDSSVLGVTGLNVIEWIGVLVLILATQWLLDQHALLVSALRTL